MSAHRIAKPEGKSKPAKGKRSASARTDAAGQRLFAAAAVDLAAHVECHDAGSQDALRPEAIRRRLQDLRELARRYNRIGAIADERGATWNEAARAEGQEWRERKSGTPE